MRTILDVQILKIEDAKAYNGQPSKHATELTYKSIKTSSLGEEVSFKRIKSSLS